MSEFAAYASKGPSAGRLAGKVALVTRGGGDQGQGVALLFAQAGATVFAGDINPAGLHETEEMAVELGVTVHTALVDATN